LATKLPIGVQLFSVRKECAKDLPGTLKEIARIGYDGVEFAGYYNYSAKDLRKMLDDLGLKCCGTHTRLNTLQGDELPKTIEFNQTLGNPYLIVPALDGKYGDTPESWQTVAAIFNTIAEALKPHAMATGYHNHMHEFKPMANGKTGWDNFFGNTRPEVIMQVDTGNAMHAGVDVTPFISHYPGRAITVHLKEYAGDRGKALIGEGAVKWPEMFKLCESVGGTKWYIVEQETAEHPPLQCIDLCLKNLRAMGK